MLAPAKRQLRVVEGVALKFFLSRKPIELANAIADAGFGHDQVAKRSVRVGRGQLPSQFAHMDMDVAVLALIRLAPDRAEQATFRDQASGVCQKNAQDLELTRRQVDPFAAHASLVTGGVELERPEGDPTERIGGRPGGMTHRDSKTGVQLVDAERLRDVVVSSSLEGLDLLALLISTRQDDDRRSRLTADPPDDVKTVILAGGIPKLEADVVSGHHHL
jgi:hypothetical protein